MSATYDFDQRQAEAWVCERLTVKQGRGGVCWAEDSTGHRYTPPMGAGSMGNYRIEACAILLVCNAVEAEPQ